MNINNFLNVTFACFNKPINCIEHFLNDYYEDKIKRQKVYISRVKKDADVFFTKFEKLKELKECRNSYNAFFNNPLINTDKTIMISSLEDGWYTLCNVISSNLNCEYYLFELTVMTPMHLDS